MQHSIPKSIPMAMCAGIGCLVLMSPVRAADKPTIVAVEGQPLANNAERLLDSLQFLSAPPPAKTTESLRAAIKSRDAVRIQEALDPHVLFLVTINPESRVKAARGPAEVRLQQGGFVPVIVKVENQSTVKKALHVTSPQAGPVYSGGAAGRAKGDKDNFLQVSTYTKPPMTANLSGLSIEYSIVLIYSSQAGKREATIGFDVGQGTQDLGFRAEVPVLFDVRPAIPVKLSIKDFDGQPTVGRFTFRDGMGQVYPPKANRLAPDFFFQDQVYRPDGGTVLLPPGEYTVVFSRGPEYYQVEKKFLVPERGRTEVPVKLLRWINPADFGFYSGDHHIHAAGCAHYTSPTEGVFAKDMFLHVKGEALNVGCTLTWGPCYEFQRQFFEPTINKLSEPFTVIKYDIEISGFGSQALGHVCLINLRDQTYPGSEGTKTHGWPTWTTPAMRWAKQQGAVTGYAHSANGLTFQERDIVTEARRLMSELDADHDGKISAAEAAKGLLPEDFQAIDANGKGFVTENDLQRSLRRVVTRLPNDAIPPMNGIGAQEIAVTTAQGLCDFISAMDTSRVPEWNCWYHIMNCGFPLKASGETDFPCISGSRVGQGRVYVQLGKIDHVDFTAWCEGLRKGRSYISDGYAHALEFKVNGQAPGFGDVKLDQPGKVTIKAKVAFASALPLGTSVGAKQPSEKTRNVEIVVNGKAVASKIVPADNQIHELSFEVPIEQSSWVALRQFPELHTNPVNVLIENKPIRASRKSAQWCVAMIQKLWTVRGPGIADAERGEAEKTFRRAEEIYRKIAADAKAGT